MVREGLWGFIRLFLIKLSLGSLGGATLVGAAVEIFNFRVPRIQKSVYIQGYFKTNFHWYLPEATPWLAPQGNVFKIKTPGVCRGKI